MEGKCSSLKKSYCTEFKEFHVHGLNYETIKLEVKITINALEKHERLCKLLIYFSIRLDREV